MYVFPQTILYQKTALVRQSGFRFFWVCIILQPLLLIYLCIKYIYFTAVIYLNSNMYFTHFVLISNIYIKNNRAISGLEMALFPFFLDLINRFGLLFYLLNFIFVKNGYLCLSCFFDGVHRAVSVVDQFFWCHCLVPFTYSDGYGDRDHLLFIIVYH